MIGSVLAIIVFAADVWAIISVLGSATEFGNKVVWTLVILFLPVLGFLLWLAMGPKPGRARIR
jgi:hypothetical protein